MWLKIDDNFTDDPRLEAVSDPAARLHIAGMCFCARFLTDGIVSADRVPRLVPRFRKTALTELLKQELWRQVDGGAAYELPDYLRWNPTRADAESEHKRKREAGRKGAQSRWQQR